MILYKSSINKIVQFTSFISKFLTFMIGKNRFEELIKFIYIFKDRYRAILL